MPEEKVALSPLEEARQESRKLTAQELKLVMDECDGIYCSGCAALEKEITELREKLASQQRQVWDFSEQERHVISDLARQQNLSEVTVLRQGLRVYQCIAAGTHDLRILTPTLKKAEALSSQQTEESK